MRTTAFNSAKAKRCMHKNLRVVGITVAVTVFLFCTGNTMEWPRERNQKSKAELLPPHIVFAEAQYKISMDELLISPQSFSDTELLEKHDQSLQNSLKLVTGPKPLTYEERQSIKIHLERVFTHYKETNLKKRNISTPAIGIDLGTTYCCVAVVQNGRVKIIKTDLGQNKAASYIGFHNRDPDPAISDTDDVVVVGDTAKKLAHQFPSTTIFDTKRMIGRQFDDPRIQNQVNLWPFDVKKNDENGEILIKTTTSTNESENSNSDNDNVWKTPEEIAIYLIKYLKKIAEDILGSEVFNAVVAVPAYFNSHQRELTKEACTLAGLNILQLVNEPTAGAVAYNIHKREYDSNEFNLKSEPKTSRNCLIFDLGGGTFDVAVLTMKNEQIHIKAVGGDSHLGGEDFDNNMVDYCLKEFQEKYGIDLIANKNSKNISEKNQTSKLLRRLKKACEEQKCFLTHAKRVNIQVDLIHDGNDLSVPMSLENFEELNQELFQKCMDIVEKVVEESMIKKEDIDDIVLVGGSSRIPKLQQMLSELFGGKKLFKEIEPDEAVAVGAAKLAHMTENLQVANILIQEPQFEFKPVPKPRPRGIQGRGAPILRSNTSSTTAKERPTTTILGTIGSRREYGLGSGLGLGSTQPSRSKSFSELIEDQATPTVQKHSKMGLSFWIKKLNFIPKSRQQQSADQYEKYSPIPSISNGGGSGNDNDNISGNGAGVSVKTTRDFWENNTKSGGGDNNKKKEGLRKEDIGTPIDFRHVQHVGPDLNGVFVIRGSKD